MRLEVLKGETTGRLRNRFMRKVQLEDEAQDNEAKLHWERGYLEGINAAQKEVEQIKKGEEMENLREKRDGHKLSSAEVSHLFKPLDNPMFDATLVAQNVPIERL